MGSCVYAGLDAFDSIRMERWGDDDHGCVLRLVDHKHKHNHTAAVRRDDWSRTGGAFVPHPAGGVVYGGLLPGNRGLAEGFWLLDVLGLLE